MEEDYPCRDGEPYEQESVATSNSLAKLCDFDVKSGSSEAIRKYLIRFDVIC